MGTRIAFSIGLGCIVSLAMTAVLLADFYDNFDDGWYSRDPNNPAYDANDPNWTDPNNAVRWDIDNPDWHIMQVIGSTFYAGAGDGWLRLYADNWLPYAFIGASVEDGDLDPNTSTTFYDDSAPHYILARMKNYDPCAGEVMLVMHGDYDVWTAYMGSLELEWIPDGASWERRQLTIANLNGTSWSGASYQNRTDLDNAAGFWMVLQFDGDGDPNHSYLRLSAWNGGKFDWDGVWDLEENAVTTWDPNDALFQYWSDGVVGYGTLGADGDHSPGHADAKFDEIECRWGTFTNVSRTLALTVKTPEKGSVTIDPDLLDDPNHASRDPNILTDPNELRRYTDGTEVVLVATPVAGKSWRAWKIYDPNHPGDANYAVEDSNTILYLTMDGDYEIEAIFKCGSGGVMPPMAVAAFFLVVIGLRRRSS
jgi:hypothetical protein